MRAFLRDWVYFSLALLSCLCVAMIALIFGLGEVKDSPITGLAQGFVLSLLLLAGVLIVLIKTKRREAGKITLISLLAIVVGVYATEIFLHVRGHIFYTTLQSHPFRVVLTMRSDGIDAFPYTYQNFIRLDGKPIIVTQGVADKETVFCKEAKWSFYHSDEYGFNNPKGIWGNPITIVGIGDSYTHGACVDQDETWPAIVRRVYPQTLNLSAAGLGAAGLTLITREYLTQIKPQLVIFAYYSGNDLCDIQAMMKREEVASYIKDEQYKVNLMDRRDEIDSLLQARFSDDYLIDRLARRSGYTNNIGYITNEMDRYVGVIHHVLLLRTLREHLFLYANLDLLFFSRSRKPSVVLETEGSPRRSSYKKKSFDCQSPYIEDGTQDNAVSLTLSLIEKANQTIKSWGGRFIVAYIPERNEIHEFRESSPQRQTMVDLFKNLGVGVIDLREDLSKIKELKLIYADNLNRSYHRSAHFNAGGYRLVGESILDYLEKNNMP